MKSYVLSPRAREDLSQIWDYTAEHWGLNKADRYLRQISTACSDLASGRKYGRSAGWIRPGYLKYVVGSHTIYFTLQVTGQIRIVRVLHQAMDVDRHL